MRSINATGVSKDIPGSPVTDRELAGLLEALGVPPGQLLTGTA